MVWGSTHWLTSHSGEVQSFLRRGGQLVVFTDGTPDPLLTFNFGIAAGPEVEAAEPEDGFHGNRLLPFVEASPGRAEPGSFAEAFKGFERGQLVANLPGYFEPSFNGGVRSRAVAQFTGTVAGTFGRFDSGDVAFAVEIKMGEGRALFVADQAMFTNEWLYSSAIGNGQLALKLARRMAVTDDGRPRKYAYFVEDDTPRDRLDLPRRGLPWDKLANVVLEKSNGLIAEAEEQNLFNDLLGRMFGRRRLIRGLAITLGIMTLTFLVRRWLGARGNVTPAFEGTAGMFPSRGRTARSVVNSMVEQGDLALAARQRVRLRLEDAGLYSGAAMPTASIRAGVRDAKELRLRLDRVIYIGWGRQTFPVGDGAWREFNRDLDIVIESGQLGDWYVSGEA